MTLEAGLYTRWKDLTSFCSEATRDKWWKIIIEAYGPRPFRNLSHLASMLTLFDKHKDCMKDRYATAFAIVFKNLVYDPHSGDSAEKSAKLLRDFAQETTFDSENYVADLIIASGSSSTDAHLTPGVTGSEDVHYVIDFDMAFLADEHEKFIQHEKDQRKEYEHLSDEDYSKQRLKVLKLFLQIPNIFATKEVREDLEEKARQNIQNEIMELEGGRRVYS